jgi:pentatricopeptide repeat protein
MVFGKLFNTAQEAKKKRTADAAIAKKAPALAQEKKRKSDAANAKKVEHPAAHRKRSPTNEASTSRSPKRRRENHHHKKPSQSALDLSSQLQELSRQKRLSQALELYWSKSKETDGHHACILVDCCARCGAVDQAEKIVAALGNEVNVETQTALMKGYAHAGRMHQAIELFRSMTRGTRQPPNVRTLNTLLRGCLWTGASTSNGSSDVQEIAGGVVTAEEAWKLYVDTVGPSSLDISSYEYYITLLCLALRTKDAQARIQEFQNCHGIRIKGKASITGGDQSSLEGMAVAYVALARAHALRGEFDEMWQACQRVLSAARSSRVHLTEQANEPEQQPENSKKNKWDKKAVGGKQAWKSSRDTDSNIDNLTARRRAASNQAFRNHRLSEVENEAKLLLKLRREGTADVMVKNVALCLLRRLFYFSGGGTTDLTAAEEARSLDVSSSPLNLAPSWLSFGLSQLVGQDLRGSDCSEIARKDLFVHFDLVPLQPLYDNGLMNFQDIFDDGSLPVDIELGAGFGDWIARQARANKKRNYIAVELRADRVAQIFARGVLESTNQSPFENLCVVGSECGSFLRDRISARSISTIFANHPEPPTQTYGDDRNDLQSIMRGGNEPAHMLNSVTIMTMAGCLKPGGRIVIVTDNRWYARLLSVTIVRAITTLSEKGLHRLCSEQVGQLQGVTHLESFGGTNNNAKVELFEGQPNEAVGHACLDRGSGGASYFDRLWRSGAGSHAEKRARFIIVLKSV